MRWNLFDGTYGEYPIAALDYENVRRVLRADRKDKENTHTAKCAFDGMEMRAEMRFFEDYNAVDWVLWLKNTDKRTSMPLKNICAADLFLPLGRDEKFFYEGINGDTCSAENFLPFSKRVNVGFREEIMPVGGRSSDGSFPFFELSDLSGGVIVAIGWTGQWKYGVERDESGVRLTVGVNGAEFCLEPDEEIRLNRVLLMGYSGDKDAARVKFRRLMAKHFSPKDENGCLPTLPCAIQDFDRYWLAEKDWATEKGQQNWINRASKLGCIDTVWLDAAWYRGRFPFGVGNYSFRPGFPNGLRPNSDEARRRGMKYMLWFEPERVSLGSEVEEEHPEWVIFTGTEPRPDLDAVRASDDVWEWTPSGLFNLGVPDAEKYLAKKLIDFMCREGIQIYREDYNIDPLPYWREKDTPNRRGMTQIKYVMGFYRLWDDIHAAFPGMLFDNCAGGGRRNDLETMMRAVPLWRSDTGCSPISEDSPSDVWNQCQSMALSRYLPYHAIAAWNFGAYEFRSAATNGIAAQFDVLNENFDFEKAGKCLQEFTVNREYWKGDFWPLTAITTDNTAWAAWQLNKPEEGKGLVMAFRRAQSPYDRAVFELRELDESAEYELEIIDEDRNVQTKRANGADMSNGLEVILDKKRTSTVIRYRRV